MAIAHNRVESQFTQTGDIGSVYGGVTLDRALTVPEAIEAGGLDWRVRIGSSVWDSDKKTKIPGYRGTVRVNSDGSTVGLGIVKGRYVPLQNQDAFNWLQGLIGKDGAAITSAGVLFNGRFTWVCVDLGAFDVLPGDTVNKHMVVINSHDASSNVMVYFLPHRLVCQNMLNFSSSPIKVRHTNNAMGQLAEAERIMSIAVKNFDTVKEAFNVFRKVEVSSKQADELIYRSLDVDSAQLNAFYNGEFKKIPQWVGHAASIHEMLEKGPGANLPGVQGTIWGVYNAFTAYYDHVRLVRNAKDDPDVAIESKMLKHSAEAKITAYKACVEMAQELKN